MLLAVGRDWDGALARPVTNPRHTALHANAAAAKRIHRLDAVGIVVAVDVAVNNLVMLFVQPHQQSMRRKKWTLFNRRFKTDADSGVNDGTSTMVGRDRREASASSGTLLSPKDVAASLR